MRKAAITGTGFFAPERVIPNQYFNDLYKKDVDTFLREQRNISERRYMKEDQRTSDLILPAAREALKNAGITPEDLTLIIVATDTPDYLSPSTAAVVQYRLGAKNAGTFDLNAACAGFVTALDVAKNYITGDETHKNILVVGAYGMSKYLNFEDYKIATLFADGAGAVVVGPTQGACILASQLETVGVYHDHMGIYAGGTALPITEDVLAKKDHLLNFAKKIPTETNGQQWPRLTHLLLNRLHKKPEDISHFFFTQINIQSIHQTLDALGLPHSLSHNIMKNYGYTGSAAIPMTLADAARTHKLQKGDLVFMLASGGGMAMAALALEWAYDT